MTQSIIKPLIAAAVLASAFAPVAADALPGRDAKGVQAFMSTQKVFKAAKVTGDRPVALKQKHDVLGEVSLIVHPDYKTTAGRQETGYDELIVPALNPYDFRRRGALEKVVSDLYGPMAATDWRRGKQLLLAERGGKLNWEEVKAWGSGKKVRASETGVRRFAAGTQFGYVVETGYWTAQGFVREGSRAETAEVRKAPHVTRVIVDHSRAVSDYVAPLKRKSKRVTLVSKW